jgi:hypothetical protein
MTQFVPTHARRKVERVAYQRKKRTYEVQVVEDEQFDGIWHVQLHDGSFIATTLPFLDAVAAAGRWCNKTSDESKRVTVQGITRHQPTMGVALSRALIERGRRVGLELDPVHF